VVFLAMPFLALAAAPALADGDDDAEPAPEGEEDADGEAACATHDDCPAKYECKLGECVALELGQCRKDADCADFRDVSAYCDLEKQFCRYYCDTDAVCDPGEYCDLDVRKCTPITGDDFCTYDRDCPADQYCEMSLRRCRPSCQSHDDCPEGYVCHSPRCEPGVVDGDEDGAPGDRPIPDGDDAVVLPDGDESADGDRPSGFVDGDDGAGGLIDCPPGEVCTSGGDQETAAEGGSSGCAASGGAPWAWLLLAALAGRRKRF